MVNHPNRSKNKNERTTQTLRDALFEELEELRAGSGDPSRALAVANLAKQIVNIAKVELDFHRTLHQLNESGQRVEMGTLKLGSVAGAARAATAA